MVAQRMPESDNGVIRVAAVGDVHCSSSCPSTLKSILAHISTSADVLALCGDLTNHGLPEEARALVNELAMLRSTPIVAVLGNHDYESNQVDELCRIIRGAGIHLLDGDVVELHDVDFVGVKGFGGGFDRGTLSAFGEPAMKHFVQEAMDEVKKLESALARSKQDKRIALLHYAPIRRTVEGEAEEIFPFLGSSRLEEPLNRYQVTACVHGHAHRGAP
ncbi:MAG TPA: metallophosphoesterase, partial [Tepidisphaeraceae bacterium]|nr:metallophosphoesterase [Tepidisphaeraceae bacterium]